MIQPAQPKETHQSETRLESNGTEHKDVSVSIGATQHTQPSVTLQDHPKLSEREIQILNSLVKGHATKVIARTCDVSEATVKVDMKSIMRKIRLGNRSQAAVWAIQNGYAANGFNRRLLCPDSATIAASITEAAIKSVATIVDRFRNAEAELPALAHADSVGDKARPGSDTWPLLIDEVRKTDIGAAKRRGE